MKTESLQNSIRLALSRPTSEKTEAVGPSAQLTALWLGAGTGALRLEVCQLDCSQRPTVDLMRRAWKQRRSNRVAPVLIFWEAPDGRRVLLCGPSAQDPAKVPVFDLSYEPAAEILRQSLTSPPQHVIPMLLKLIERAFGDGGIPGFRNRNLVSTHCAAVSFRRDQPRWKRLVESSQPARSQSGVDLLRAVGYTKAIAPGVFIVEHQGRTVVYATVLQEGTPFDRATTTVGQDPATAVLSEARKRHATRAVIVSGRLVRTYAVVQSETLDDIPTAATYTELDLDLLNDENVGLLALLAGADSLKPGGAFEQLQEESRIYNRELRQRFQRAIYDRVIGRLVEILWHAGGLEVQRQPQASLSAALLLLFRLLFVLYAEDRRLLPMSNSAYRHVSLTEMLFRIERRDREGGNFDKHASDYWAGIKALFHAIRRGHVEWGVAEYDGGLFETDSPDRAEAAILEKVELSNAALAPLLLDLAFDGSVDERGKIDFWDIGVRYLGTLYEGLLSYKVRIADHDIKIVGGEYKVAGPDDRVDVHAGEPYLITPQGGRKITGTYYTPNFVVRRLIDEALRPTLEDHLLRIVELPVGERWRAMLDFRVVDPAMGSGHFLVDTVDAIADRLAAFLEQHKEIDTAPVGHARDHLNELGRAQGIDGLGDAVPDFDLLRRIVLKNCVYGVDMQPMAVELSRLGLWLHTFVPGMPLSYLGHGLRQGNSLVGIVGDEIDRSLGGKLFGSMVQDTLARALEPARAIGAGGDLTVHDVQESANAQLSLEDATIDLRRAYDVFSCRCFMTDAGGTLENTDALQEIVNDGKLALGKSDIKTAFEIAGGLCAFHWQLAFPEVFLRERPGFDVVLGNPPWEETNTDFLSYYASFIPGIKSIDTNEARQREIDAFDRRHPDIASTLQAEIERNDRLQKVFASTMHRDRTDFRGNCESGVTHRDYLTLPFVAQARRLLFDGRRRVAKILTDA